MKNNELFARIDMFTEEFLRMSAELGIEDSELSNAARKLFDGICGGITCGESIRLESDNAVLEIIDKNSGRLLRRYLELEYLETANGIMLTGENIAGEPAQIVYLSESAIGRIHELQGEGWDSPRCNDNNHF